MAYIEKLMDSYAEELLKNHNLAKEEEQRNLTSKEDFLQILKPVVRIIENNKDASLEELRELLFQSSGVKESLKTAVYEKSMAPGAVVSFGTKNYHETLSVGCIKDNIDLHDRMNHVSSLTLYDLSSVTKMFTSICIQILARKNMIDLNKKMSYYLPDFPGLENITIYELLTFNAPVKTDGRVDRAKEKEEAERIIRTISFDDTNDGKRPYTDMGAMVLKYLVEKVTGMDFYEFIKTNILDISNMPNTYVSIPEDQMRWVAPTGNNGFYYKDGNYRINTDVKIGDCYDEKARIMGQRDGNLSGHAGLFSTGYDMSNLSQTLLKGEVLTNEELCHMADNETGKKGLPIQYLGKLCYSKNPSQPDSEVYHPLSGRTVASAGWTGTQLTVDPDNEIFYSLLSNRSYNRMTFIDDTKRDLIKEDEMGKKTILLPNGVNMIDASKYAWDRDAVLVHPVIKLAMQYRFLEEIYNEEVKKKGYPYYKQRRF